jgi:hypothetical protein
MRLIENTGTNRVTDVLSEAAQPGYSFDIATPSTSPFAFAALRDVLEKANSSRLITSG